MSAEPIPRPVPDAAGPRLAEAERRRSDRVAQQAAAWLSGPAGHHTSGRQCGVRDLSLHGVGLVSDRPCEPGERRWVLINRGPMRLSTRVEVASCRRRDDGTFEIGGEFY